MSGHEMDHLTLMDASIIRGTVLDFGAGGRLHSI
jgi:hypothetical protein